MNAHSQSGMSLLSMMMGLAITSFLMMVLTTTIARAGQEGHVISGDADLRDLRLRLAIATDCARTRAAAPSCNGSSIQLIDAFGDTLVGYSATKFGKYQVRAECRSGNIAVRVKRPSDSWANAKDLYPPRTSLIFSCTYR